MNHIIDVNYVMLIIIYQKIKENVWQLSKKSIFVKFMIVKIHVIFVNMDNYH